MNGYACNSRDTIRNGVLYSSRAIEARIYKKKSLVVGLKGLDAKTN
jgi:hypothetical protein